MVRSVARRALPAALAVVFATAVASCGGGGGGGSTGGTTGTITLGLSSSSGTVAPGGQVALVGTVTRGGGFTGDVAITVTGAPAGVTGAAGTVITVGTTSTATVTILVATTTAPGTYPLTATASGSGVTSSTETFTLTVSAGAQSYTLTTTPTAASIAAGGNANFTVNINRSGFAGSVNLSVPNLPTGFQQSFSPNNTTANTATLTITVGASVAPGLYQLTVGGVAAGQQDQLTFISITVPAVGSYSLSVAPTTVNVAQGSSNTATVTITRTGGFTGAVGMTATGNPSLLTPSFAPTSVTGTSSTVTFTAGATQATGSYAVTLHGSASGFTSDQTVPVTVVVTASGGGGGNAILNFSACTGSQLPIWVAFQDGIDGTGAWTPVTGTNNVYQFNITQAKGAYAYAAGLSGASQISVVYYTRSELTATPFVFCPAAGTNSMSGTVAGLTSGQEAHVAMDNQAVGPSFPTTTFTLSKLFSGTWDLFAWRTNVVSGPSTSDRFIVRRNQSVQNGGTISLLDFGGAEAMTPGAATVTVPNAGGGQVIAEMTYYTSNCTSAGLLYFLTSVSSPFTIYGVPTANQAVADFHNLIVGVTSGNTTVETEDFFHTLGNRTATMPATLTMPTVTAPAGNYKRLMAVLTIPSDYNDGASFSYSDATHFVSMTQSAGYIGGSTATFTMPVFSGLTGFTDSWGPTAGLTDSWSAQATGGNITGAGGVICAEGGHLAEGVITGSN